MSKKKKKKKEPEHQTYFEMQEEMWYGNNCQGSIEEYGFVGDVE